MTKGLLSPSISAIRGRGL